jgi:hypothetical protein
MESEVIVAQQCVTIIGPLLKLLGNSELVGKCDRQTDLDCPISCSLKLESEGIYIAKLHLL